MAYCFVKSCFFAQLLLLHMYTFFCGLEKSRASQARVLCQSMEFSLYSSYSCLYTFYICISLNIFDSNCQLGHLLVLSFWLGSKCIFCAATSARLQMCNSHLQSSKNATFRYLQIKNSFTNKLIFSCQQIHLKYTCAYCATVFEKEYNSMSN